MAEMVVNHFFTAQDHAEYQHKDSWKGHAHAKLQGFKKHHYSKLVTSGRLCGKICKNFVFFDRLFVGYALAEVVN